MSDEGEGSRRSSARRWVRRAPGVLVGALGVVGFGPASMLVLVGETRPVRLFGGVAVVDPAVDLLRRQGSAVEYDVFMGEDHFLFFSRRPEIFERLGAWMAGIERPLAVEKAGER
jgi:hypothetical protein